MIRFLGFVAIIAIIDIYAFQAIKSAFETSKNKTIIYYTYWGFTALSVLFFLLSSIYDFRHNGNALTRYTFGIIVAALVLKLILVIFLLVEDFFRLGKLGVNTLGDQSMSMSRSSFFSKVALGIGGLPFVAFLYGMAKSAYDYQIKQITVKIPHLPESYHGLKIVQLSDIHSGSFTRREPIVDAVKKINDLKPDLFFFTGDLVNDLAREIDPYIDIFKEIKAKYGQFSITGNHDYADYVEWVSEEDKKENFRQFVSKHSALNWKILMNENFILKNEHNDELAIIGVENWGHNLRFKKYGKLNVAIKGAEHIPTKILLSHDPSHWDAEVRKDYPDIDLTLSGHTHGFQMGVETKYFKFSPVQWVYKQWAGLYKEGKQHLYVNRGFGFIGFPGRVGILPEITLITLERG